MKTVAYADEEETSSYCRAQQHTTGKWGENREGIDFGASDCVIIIIIYCCAASSCLFLSSFQIYVNSFLSFFAAAAAVETE